MQDENYEEVKSKTFKFGAEGDYLVGTFIEVSKTNSPDAYGKLSHIYRVKAKEGKFYGSTKNPKTKKWELDKEQTIVKEGEDYVFFISDDKGVVIGAMKDIVSGQKFKIVFEEEKPTTKGNPAKIIKVFAGKNADGTPAMDKEYLASKTETLEEVADDLRGKKEEK